MDFSVHIHILPVSLTVCARVSFYAKFVSGERCAVGIAALRTKEIFHLGRRYNKTRTYFTILSYWTGIYRNSIIYILVLYTITIFNLKIENIFSYGWKDGLMSCVQIRCLFGNVEEKFMLSVCVNGTNDDGSKGDLKAVEDSCNIFAHLWLAIASRWGNPRTTITRVVVYLNWAPPTASFAALRLTSCEPRSLKWP